MKIKDLIELVGGTLSGPRAEDTISGLTLDSRQVEPGYCFIALPGALLDGRDYVRQAVENGAVLILHDDRYPLSGPLCGPVVAAVSDLRKRLACLAAGFYGLPEKVFKLIGVTGTNGKTTVSWLLERLLSGPASCGLIGTIAHRVGEKRYAARNTTPDLLSLYRMLAEMREAGLSRAVMEVSSHALDQGRVEGLEFQTAVFTNLTRDHLDYHKTMENYFQVKSRLFSGLKEENTAVLNYDDPYGRDLGRLTPARVFSYAIADPEADYRAEDIRINADGTGFNLIYPNGALGLFSPLVGRHNVYNLLAACAAASAAGIPLEEVSGRIAGLPQVPGRMERFDLARDVRVFVDYAHTPDALANVLSALRQLNPQRLHVVFGCGGDRDRGKRPRMGDVAAGLADTVTLTSDNPRNEDPGEILNEIVSGFSAGFTGYRIIEDRESAIRTACEQAGPGDFVLVAGKGHENYQIFRDRTVRFDDREIVKNLRRGCSN